ncbi:MAG: ATP-binding protein [Bacillota bacterium]
MAVSEELHAGDVQASALRHKLGKCWLLSIWRNMRDGIIAVDNGNRVIFMNPAAEKLAGYRYRRSDPPTLEEVFVFKCPPAPDGGTGIVALRDGSEIPVEYCCKPVIDDQGHSQGRIVIMRDITKLRKLEEKNRKTIAALEQVELLNSELIEEMKNCHLAENKLLKINSQLEKTCKAKDNFLARMSHDLRTPLNAVIGFTSTLLMRLPGPLTEEQERQLHNISVSARHLLSMINNLLDLSRLEAGHLVPHREKFACGAYVSEIASTMSQLAENKGLKLTVKAPEPEIIVFTDRQILCRILLNLIDNAIKYSEQGEISIHTCTPSPGRVEISVADSGIGISREDMKRLFDPFAQVDPGHSEGIGLGLYLCNMLAQTIDGSIAVRSQPGVGSEFTLILEENRGRAC